MQDNNSIHVAIIMDGNGRWATLRGKPRFFGHQAGTERIRDVLKAVSDYPVSILTLYAFSSDNWKRPVKEVNFLMQLFQKHLSYEVDECVREGIRLNFIGRRDRIPSKLYDMITGAEKLTASGERLNLRIALDYSARDAILGAARSLANSDNCTAEKFSQALRHYYHSCPVADVDLLIRTGGEKRMSDFLLWECAYAELYFTDTMWPDFDQACFREAMYSYYSRERRFGRILQEEAV
ncbi:MAG: di-trans,poly-cis-decaprenylcistransferase [Calditrichaeota bacterium]|nr:di-trans,poly-cis-decaprenylcistransferase [Calditrichota bacterium]RQW08040.1 MAG: di-trans,poly-cis-decaprenylcistransferase [Calditrichota bacterium]